MKDAAIGIIPVLSAVAVQAQPASPDLFLGELREIALFGALSDDSIQYLVGALRPVSLAAGQELYHQGEQPRELYLVLSGRLDVICTNHQGHEVRRSSVGPHDWVGEMSVIDMQCRPATVRAAEPSFVLGMSAAHLDALYRRDLKGYSLLVLNIARELSRRLRIADAQLAEHEIEADPQGELGGGPKRQASIAPAITTKSAPPS